MFPTIVEVLVMIGKNYSNLDDKAKAQGILYSLKSFHFIFMVQQNSIIYGYTNNLCLVLQRNDQDIVRVMPLVSFSKGVLQNLIDLDEISI